MKISRNEYILALAVFIVTLFISIGAGFFSRSVNSNLQNSSSKGEQSNEIILVYIGSSTCPACNNSDLPDKFNEIRDSLQVYVESNGYSFSTLGITKDWNIDNGVQHLRQISDFNEISTGGSWMNSLLSRYIFDEFPGRAATPQLLLVQREYGVIMSGEKEYYQGIDSEHLKMRLIGLNEIFDYKFANFNI